MAGAGRRRSTQVERSARTRSALLEAAAKGFSRYGYGNLVLEEVARDAGYARGALYHQFKDKEDLALAVVERGGYRQMLTAARRWPERTWAVEGSQGIGRHVAQRLVADGEAVVDVPAKLSARARVFSSGLGRKTVTSAGTVEKVGMITKACRSVAPDRSSLDRMSARAGQGSGVFRDCPGLS